MRQSKCSDPSLYDYAAWYNQGTTLLNLGEFKEAITSFDKTLKIIGDHYEAWYDRGIALLNLGYQKKAIASFDKALKIKPDHYKAWHYRGEALWNLGKVKDAADSWDKAERIYPDYYGTQNNEDNTKEGATMTTTEIQGYSQAFSAFKDSEDFEQAIITATKLDINGEGLYLQLWTDGTYQVANAQNRVTGAVTFLIPSMSDDEYDWDEENLAIEDPFTWNAQNILEEIFEDWLENQ